jgi:uncharacterized protein YajQ (UPF0234 family)
MSGVEYDDAIAFAMRLKTDQLSSEVFRYIGYYIYLGVPDAQIAVKWRIPSSHIQALRFLFFDFSRLPKDKIARSTFFRQLVIANKFTEKDYEFYKLLDDLGDIALKTLSSSKLSLEEENKLKRYLGASMLENALKLKMISNSSLKDATNYNNAIHALGAFYIKEAELKLTAVREEQVRTLIKKTEIEMGTQVQGDEHEKLVDLLKAAKTNIRELSLQHKPMPVHREISSLK